MSDDLLLALEPVQQMLQADGYDLAVDAGTGSGSHTVRIEIIAGPDACADCLVPVEVFRSVVSNYLPDEISPEDLEIKYPAESSH